MAVWTDDQLTKIGDAVELTMQAQRPDGSLRAPLPIWVVRDGDALYVRSFKGEAGAWYRAARASGAGHIRAGGVETDVALSPVTDSDIAERIDAAYSSKYRSYGAAYVGPMTSPAARTTTLKLTPR